MIACCHPGKIGDALYALPTIRELARIHNCKVDFYTSEVCYPIKEFMEIQEPINECIIPSNYVVGSTDQQGVQPWYMDQVPENKYEKVYQLGFKDFPDCSLPEFIANSIGLDKKIGQNIYYDFIKTTDEYEKEKYVVIAPGRRPIFYDAFDKLIEYIKMPVYVVGNRAEYTGVGINCTSMTFNDMTSLISGCHLYIGTFSSPLVIANGFDVPKLISQSTPADYIHTVQKPKSHYIFEPSFEQLKHLTNLYL